MTNREEILTLKFASCPFLLKGTKRQETSHNFNFYTFTVTKLPSFCMLVLTPWQGDATQLSAWGLSGKAVEISPPPQEMVEVSPPPLGSVVLLLHHYKSKKHLVNTQINMVLHFKYQKESNQLTTLHITNLLIVIGFRLYNRKNQINK